ncbi:hypothetical protein JR632_002908 [Listeria monocytogenes]|nr:hypothetical protein [Listeria monocytogenes]EAF4467790.1 hypothetical protein [Listeria monocytogenes serotype 1/2a]EAG3119347.1 hypothetical protein [Listeria monocytogenes]EHD1719328.1 hypothetical protein [Listeria monocytogenes]HAO6691622.1 hypothetical protein [Listeria monocytogenes]
MKSNYPLDRLLKEYNYDVLDLEKEEGLKSSSLYNLKSRNVSVTNYKLELIIALASLLNLTLDDVFQKLCLYEVEYELEKLIGEEAFSTMIEGSPENE